MLPEETVQASIDLSAKKLLPVHWAKFSLSLHAWDEPIIRIKKEAGLKNVYLIHPMIGEYVDLDANRYLLPGGKGFSNFKYPNLTKTKVI